jgi:hypothetical protein
LAFEHPEQEIHPSMYTLHDHRHERIKGRAFYEEEMQKVKYADIYLVEKVIKRSKKGNYKRMVLVKWLGFPDDRNSWIPEADMLS